MNIYCYMNRFLAPLTNSMPLSFMVTHFGHLTSRYVPFHMFIALVSVFPTGGRQHQQVPDDLGQGHLPALGQVHSQQEEEALCSL